MVNNVRAITPSEARQRKDGAIPDFVLEAFNEMISENLNLSGSATIRQDDVLARALSKRPGITGEMIFDKKWFDVEKVYAASGWKVKYDKPGYNESYPATFTFEPRRD